MKCVRSMTRQSLFALLLVCTAYSPAFASGAVTAQPPLNAPVSFADLSDALLPTVVNISSTQKAEVVDNNAQPNIPEMPEGSPFEDFFQEFMKRHQEQFQSAPPASLGSGFIIDVDKGYVITNNHVIKDAQEIRITLHDDSVVTAKVVGKDEKTDLAVLQANLKPHKVSAAKFGNSDQMRVGDWVMAIGNPFGLGGTVTAGIVSARQRDINSGPYDDYIQTDASINRGNSGGPMFNLKGEIIGINTAIFSPTGGSVGIGFAIPSSLAKPVIDQLIKYGKTRRGWLGVRIQSVSEEIAESLNLPSVRGALVASVADKGPATAAGIKAGDIVLTFDGKDVTAMRSLPRIVAETEIGKTVPVRVWRQGRELDLKVKVGELEKAEEDGLVDPQVAEDEPASPKGETLADLGIQVAPITPDMRTQFSLPEDATGLIVMDVEPTSDAGRKGLTAGDVIVEMNQTQVKTLADAQKVVASTRASNKSLVLLLVNRQGDIQFLAAKLQSKAAMDKQKAAPKKAAPSGNDMDGTNGAPAPAPME